MSNSKSESQLSYLDAMHGIQSAIAFEIEKEREKAREILEAFDVKQLVVPVKSCASPKQLRTGINSAMVNDHAVAELLIAKGIFTREEYVEQITKSANVELQRLEDSINDQHDPELRRIRFR